VQSRLTRMRMLLGVVCAITLIAQEPARVVAHGEGEVSVKPDQVRIQIGVTNQAPTAQEAGTQNAKQSSAVITELKQQLGAAAEFQTRNYSLNPMYKYPTGGGKPSITGYQANNTVEVRLSDVSLVGKAIDMSTKTGANQIQGIHFSLKDEQKARGEALAKAAAQARANAQSLASALGLRVVRLLKVEDGNPAPVVPLRAEMMMRSAAADAAPTPVEAGNIEVRATVTVTAEVAP
jgi:uncharacterized protein